MPMTLLLMMTNANTASCGWPGDQHEHEERADDGVDAGEDVRPDDLAERADRRVGYRVDATLFDSFADLGSGEASQVDGLGLGDVGHGRRG